jgi:hypothetical protein
MILFLALPELAHRQLISEAHFWGMWPSTYLDWPIRLLIAAVVLAVVWTPLLDRLRWPGGSFPGRKTQAVLAVVSLVPFYLFRIVHTRWGDAYILVNSIPHPQVQLTYSWQAPLDIFVHAKTWAIAHQWFGWTDALPAYWFWSCLCGAVFVWVLLGMARAIGRTATERWLLVGLVATLGTSELFFGYAETYTFSALLTLVYAWLGWRALQPEQPLWPVALLLAVSHAFHPITLVLGASLAYLIYHRSRSPNSESAWRFAGRDLLQCVAAYALVGGATIALMWSGGHSPLLLMGAEKPGGADGSWWVPIFQTTSKWEHYTMFSLAHLVDILNEQLLTAPVVWPMSIAAFFCAWRCRPRAAEYVFWGWMVAPFVLLGLTWNADYGGQRDWDLFSLAAIPAAIWLARALPRFLSEPAALTRSARALVAGQACLLISWVYQNTRPWFWK